MAVDVIGCRSPVLGVTFGVQPGPGLPAGDGRGPEQFEHAAGMGPDQGWQLTALLPGQVIAVGQGAQPGAVGGRVAPGGERNETVRRTCRPASSRPRLRGDPSNPASVR